MVHDLSISAIDTLDLDRNIHLSKGWLGNTGTPSFTFPNFSGLPGWKDAWGPPYGRDLSWQLGSRQTSYADPGFYIQWIRAFVAGNTAWESGANGGLNVALGGDVIALNAVDGQAIRASGRRGFRRGSAGLRPMTRGDAQATTP
jgi:hypothetical protein